MHFHALINYTVLLIVSCVCGVASAHFQVLLPSDDIVTAKEPKTVSIRLVFTHPMEQGPLMDMGPPQRVGVLSGGRHVSLLDQLRAHEQGGNTWYSLEYKVTVPRDYIFYIEPAAYWEPAEGKMIIHYAKVVINAMEAETGWDDLVDLPVEIEPLTRPYGVWTGNIFRGLVRHDGKPVPFAEVEVEYFNEDNMAAIPSSPFVTQIIKADANGVFAYAMPKAGWWGFAALVPGAKQMENPDGKLVDVELGGLIWIKTTDME